MTGLLNVLNSVEANKEIVAFIKICKEIEGFHYFTGIGKNGFVAATVAATFNSLGIRSMFVDPVNSLHGDMNIFTQRDIVICISKSGETEELLSFVRALRKCSPKTKIAVITSTKHSSILKMASCSIFLPIKHNADHLNMAPLAATLLYTALLQ